MEKPPVSDGRGAGAAVAVGAADAGAGAAEGAGAGAAGATDGSPTGDACGARSAGRPLSGAGCCGSVPASRRLAIYPSGIVAVAIFIRHTSTKRFLLLASRKRYSKSEAVLRHLSSNGRPHCWACWP